jgi:hypothetical protein
MTTRRSFLVQTAGIALGGLLVPRLPGPTRRRAVSVITIYKSASCGCCAKWVDHLKANGFQTVVHDEEGMDSVKDNLGVPKAFRSCHTALCEKYLIEGHVPAEDIQRLLKQHPKVAGLAVPGMPSGAPGMAPPGTSISGFQVVAFQLDGSSKVFAQY